MTEKNEKNGKSDILLWTIHNFKNNSHFEHLNYDYDCGLYCALATKKTNSDNEWYTDSGKKNPVI